MHAVLTAVEEVAGVQATIEQRFEREGAAKRVCVAESLGRFYAGWAARSSRHRRPASIHPAEGCQSTQVVARGGVAPLTFGRRPVRVSYRLVGFSV